MKRKVVITIMFLFFVLLFAIFLFFILKNNNNETKNGNTNNNNNEVNGETNNNNEETNNNATAKDIYAIVSKCDDFNEYLAVIKKDGTEVKLANINCQFTDFAYENSKVYIYKDERNTTSTQHSLYMLDLNATNYSLKKIHGYDNNGGASRIDAINNKIYIDMGFSLLEYDINSKKTTEILNNLAYSIFDKVSNVIYYKTQTSDAVFIYDLKTNQSKNSDLDDTPVDVFDNKLIFMVMGNDSNNYTDAFYEYDKISNNKVKLFDVSMMKYTKNSNNYLSYNGGYLYIGSSHKTINLLNSNGEKQTLYTDNTAISSEAFKSVEDLVLLPNGKLMFSGNYYSTNILDLQTKKVTTLANDSNYEKVIYLNNN